VLCDLKTERKTSDDKRSGYTVTLRTDPNVEKWLEWWE
jgi:hypothetical protein